MIIFSIYLMDIYSLNKISDISETLLIPLYARAIESKTDDPIIIDSKAIEITNKLNEILKNSQSKLHKKLLEEKLQKRLNVTLSLRTRKIDEYVGQFLTSHKNCTVVELGCGLSTRYNRIDNDVVEWYDLDFPEVVNLRKKFFDITDKYHFIPSSVLDFDWMKPLAEKKDHNFLFIAEGLLMYLHEEEVKSLVLQLQKLFPSCELVAEVANSYIVNVLKHKIWKKKFQQDFYLGKEATFNFGISESTDFEKWGDGIRFLDDWTYFDEPIKKLGLIRFFGRFNWVRKAQWIVRYRLE